MSELISGTAEIQTGAMEIPIEALEPNPYQPRGAIDAEQVEELAASIKAHGVLQPLLAREIEPRRFQIIAGERRWRAAQAAGLRTVPCIVRELDDSQTLALALVENLQREDLDPIEAARGYRRLVEEFGMTQEEVAQTVGKSRAAVANTMRLLQLPQDVQLLIQQGLLSEGHGRALLGLPDDAELISQAAQDAVEEGISVRELESFVRSYADSEAEFSTHMTPGARKPLPPEIDDLRQRFQSALATAVRIKPKRQGGVIEIEYYDDDDLTRLAEVLVGG